MIPLSLASREARNLRVLCLGAHSDDIEIGCGGTLLVLIGRGARLAVDWRVLSGAGGPREEEARGGAAAFLEGVEESSVEVMGFRDGHFPYTGGEIKAWFETLKALPRPDVIFTHARDDRHQDHREVNGLTWNTFRDHLILEYEIPKYDGDLGVPNVFVPLSEAVAGQKAELLMRCFGSQRSKSWFDEATFLGLARLRGMECQAAERHAEAFYGRKLVIA